MLTKFQELAQQLYSMSLELQKPNMQIFSEPARHDIEFILTKYYVDAELMSMHDMLLDGFHGITNHSDLELFELIEEACLNHVFEIAIPQMELVRSIIIDNAKRGIK